mmetsp:Transcript_25546/g.25785  ORF Transcript_25546/g.25785 Transcript_25546/m.25785 type:complete len:206 (+) Transcript_25546:103-720(+)|eukprot:CAMPEP_0182420468 /NCGR_PEP_ID=MMETSP1167-20130531/5303_1 /TAXON_ID=2988 /ORGANISM="Mallomonas Sp, Strain CCMP3275" /LENGTH=205 /DNA_ID=CAMNT_0024596463 /DNA_START=100 /DNA_END=717 /DNA_ORIENTATION=-
MEPLEKRARMDDIDIDIIVGAKDKTIQELKLELEKAEANVLTATERQTAYELKLISKEQQLNELQDFVKDVLKRNSYDSKVFLDPFLVNQYNILQGMLKNGGQELLSQPQSQSKPKVIDKKILKLETKIQSLKHQLQCKERQLDEMDRLSDESKAHIQQVEDEKEKLSVEVLFLRNKTQSLQTNEHTLESAEAKRNYSSEMKFET